jgi:hypothetical protein
VTRFRKLFWHLRDQLYRWLVPPYRTMVVEEFLPDKLRALVPFDGRPSRAIFLDVTAV